MRCMVLSFKSYLWGKKRDVIRQQTAEYVKEKNDIMIIWPNRPANSVGTIMHGENAPIVKGLAIVANIDIFTNKHSLQGIVKVTAV